MSYRSRLTLFFALIVLVPMAAVAVLVLQLSSESRTGKADARLASDVEVALNLFRDSQASNREQSTSIARDRQLVQALDRRDAAALQRAVSRLATQRGLEEVTVTDTGGHQLATCCASGVAESHLTLQGTAGPLGTLEISDTTPQAFLAQVQHLTAADAILTGESRRLLATPGAQEAPADLGLNGVQASRTVDVAGGKRRARTIALAPGERLTLLGPLRSAGVIASQPLLVAVLALFFGVALALILPLLRDLQQFHGTVEQQAITDELTGLSNQRRFRELMAKEVERARRFERPLSLLMMDIDDFKEINDTYGHLEGDHVLHEIAAILRSESREIDEPSRYGGEEFAVAMPETTAEGAVELAERVRRRIESTPIGLVGDSRTIEVRASFGVAGTPETPAEVSGLIAAADKALYQAKREGKNTTRKAA